MFSSLLQRLGGAQASRDLLEEKVRGIGLTHRFSCARHSPHPTECRRSARHVRGPCAGTLEREKCAATRRGCRSFVFDLLLSIFEMHAAYTPAVQHRCGS